LSGLIGKLIIGVSALAATCSFAGFVVKGLVPLYQAKKEYDAEVQKVGVWMEKNSETPPAERVASGGPPEGGSSLGKSR
jgi:hypothetical protein